MKKIRQAVAFIAVLAIVVIPVQLMACPNCKEGFTGVTSQAAVGEAYSWTIYLLIALPWFIVGFIGYRIRKSMKRQDEVQTLVG